MTGPIFTRTMQVVEHVFGPLEGRSVVDIGCGRGRLLDALSRCGAVPTGVDPSASLLAKAREMAPGVSLVQSGGQSLPFEASTFDGAILLNSLHHVPAGEMAAALSEALRVTRPGAPVLVIEPLARGGYHEVFAPVDDETAVRAAAMETLARMISGRALTESLRVEYEVSYREASVEAVLENAVAIDPSRALRVAEAREEVAARFARLAVPAEDGDGFMLDQPMIAVAFHDPGAA